MKKLGTPQFNLWLRYLDCKKRSKKKVDLPNDDGRISDDEKLIQFILRNSSIVQQDGECAYQNVSSAITLICHQLCPGQWCTRSHCKNYSSKHAYFCVKTRPSGCNDFKKYIEKQNQKRNDKV